MAQLSESEAQAILTKALGYSKSDECEATLTGGRSGNLRFARNAVSTSGAREILSLEIQSSFGKKTAGATINEFDDASIEKVVRRSEELAQLAPENAEYIEFLGEQDYLKPTSFFDGKGQPSQVSAVSHGSATTRFDKINVINTARKI